MNHKDKSIRLLPSPSVLNKTHPEIFTTKPRSGGKSFDSAEIAAEHTAIENTFDTFDTFDSSRVSGFKTSREFRLTSALEESNWTLESSTVSSTDLLGPDPLSDCLDMLAVTITTVMFLAADASKNLTKQQLNWTIQYLQNIQDEHGNVPPNVRGILNHLKHLYNNDLKQFEEQPMLVDESGKVLDAKEADMYKTEKFVVKVTHEEEPAPKPQGS